MEQLQKLVKPAATMISPSIIYIAHRVILRTKINHPLPPKQKIKLINGSQKSDD